MTRFYTNRETKTNNRNEVCFSKHIRWCQVAKTWQWHCLIQFWSQHSIQMIFIRKVILQLLFTRGQFWPSGIVVACVCVCVSVCLCVCQSFACPRDNSGPVQARIAKFGPKMQKTLVKVPIVLGGNWPWPSRSNLTSKSEFTQFWTCPDHNSLPIQARITKFGPEVENSLVMVPIVLGGNWPRPSRSNLI